MSTRRFAAPAVALTLAFTLAACGDDESATDRACDARSDLRSAIEAVGEDLAAANLGDARDSLTEVGDALGELSDALSDVADEQAEELRPEADAGRASVEGLARLKLDLEDHVVSWCVVPHARRRRQVVVVAVSIEVE